MMTPPLINIGYPKTATTYLQNLVFTNETLFTQPWGAMPLDAIEQFALVHPQRFDPESARALFLDQLSPDDTRVPVISHESLSGNPFYGQYPIDIVAKRLHATFPQARVLIGVREQHSMLRSIYFQYIREGGTKTLKYVLHTNLDRVGYRPMLRMEHFEYDLTVEHYTQLFGRQNVLVMPIELLKRDALTYMRTLAEFVGRSWDDPVPTDIVNARHPETAIRLERWVNRVLPKPLKEPERYRDTKLWVKARKKLLQKSAVPLNWWEARNPKPSGAAAEIDAFLGDRFAASNARLARMTALDLADLGYQVAR